jgi:hypothetical protein
MPLTPQNVEFTFQAGLASKVDSQQTPFGSLQVAENIDFSKIGRLDKRNGFASLKSTTEDGSVFGNPVGIAVYNNELLSFNDNNNVYSYLDSTKRWLNKGFCTSALVAEDSIFRSDTYTQINIDSFVLNGIKVVAWLDTRGGVRYCVKDASTSTMIVNDVSVSATGNNPRVIAFQGQILIYYTDSGSIKYRAIDIKNPTSLYAEVVAVNDLNVGAAAFDVLPVGAGTGGKLFLAYNNSSGIATNTFNSNLTSVASTSDGYASQYITLHSDAQQNIWVAYTGGSSSTTIATFCRTFIGKTVLPVTTIDSYSNVNYNVGNITGIETSPGVMQFAYEFIHNTSVYQSYIRTNTVTSAGSVGTARFFGTGLSLVSKWYNYGSTFLINAVYQSVYQSTYYTLDKNGNLLTRMNPGVSGGKRTGKILPNCYEVVPGTVTFAAQKKGRLQGQNGGNFSQLSVITLDIILNDPRQYSNAILNGVMHIVGGYATTYDGGSKFVEHNFHYYPEYISAVGSNTGGSLGIGSYQYVFCYEWTDQRGNVYRSLPSIPVTVISNTATTQVTITVQNYTLGNRTDVRLVVYRTEANGTTRYRCSSVTAPIVMNNAVFTTTYVDGALDSSINTNDVLYTDAGVLGNSAFHTCSSITQHKGRLFIAGGEDSLQVRYTNKAEANKPVEFSEELAFSFRVPESKITGLASLNDLLIVFTKDKIYAVSGDGPDIFGSNNNFSDLTPVCSDTGCVNSLSIQAFAGISGDTAGITFLSQKGLYLLTAGLQVQYIGAPIEDFQQNTIHATKLVPKKNQIRFITDGNCLVYTYDRNLWSIYTNYAGNDCDVWKDQFVFLKSNGKICVENGGYSDDGSAISARVGTGPINIGGLQGYQRFFKLYILGAYKGSHLLEVSVFYDGSPNPQSVQYLNPTQIMNTTPYGNDATYGSLPVYGETYQPYQFRVDAKIQSCRTLRVVIRDVQSSTQNEGFNLSGITFVIGTTGKPTRLSQKNSAQ